MCRCRHVRHFSCSPKKKSIMQFFFKTETPTSKGMYNEIEMKIYIRSSIFSDIKMCYRHMKKEQCLISISFRHTATVRFMYLPDTRGISELLKNRK